jgi:hypothetical protein
MSNSGTDVHDPEPQPTIRYTERGSDGCMEQLSWRYCSRPSEGGVEGTSRDESPSTEGSPIGLCPSQKVLLIIRVRKDRDKLGG